jgi:hypothetical protein
MTKGTCSIPGCNRFSHLRGWCQAHYCRWLRHGDPLAGRTPNGALLAWLREAAQRHTDECLQWPFSSITNGYGSVMFNGRRRLAHHVVLLLIGRELPPEGQEVRHSCDNRRCANPRHLSFGTRSDNMADMRERGRSRVGERNVNAKLTEAEVRAIRSSQARRVVLAQRYGVSLGAIDHIMRRSTWKHIP